MTLMDQFDPPAPQTAEEWIASANTLGAVIGEAVLQADALANMPALDADAVAADRRARPNAFCSFDRDPQGLRSILQEWARTPISEPFHHITIYTADAASVGLAVLHNMTAHNAEFVIACPPGLISRAVVRGLFAWAFRDHGFERLTLRVRESNEPARDYARRLGFRPEGFQRGYFGDEGAFLWGMTRRECRWIKEL